jgi:predicted ATPase
MLQRLYVNNFRCLENFELTMKEMSSALLIGKNGVGKSTIAKALEVLQAIARGTNRLRDLAKEPRLIGTKDFGEALAKECAENNNELWGHPLLIHNKPELERMISSVKPFLFAN